MIIEIKTEVAFGKEEHSVITGEKEFQESRRYERIYKVFLDSISHWNSQDDQDDVLEIHLMSGFMIPIESSEQDFEEMLLARINDHIELEMELTLKEQRLLLYLYANRLEDNCEESE